MMRHALWLVPLVALALWAGPLPAQQAKTLRAEITGEEFEYDWQANTMVFSGGCRLKVSGPDQAEMSAPKMTVQLNAAQSMVKEARTVGRTTLTLLTTPDTAGQRRRITASSDGGATYSEETQLVTLSGGAAVEMANAPAGPGAQTVHLTGEKITINLETKKINVTPARVEISGAG